MAIEKYVALITGGSSGIGKAVAVELEKKGCIVYEISRHGSSKENINHITADVTNEELVFSEVSKLIEKEGHINLLVNCAGFGIAGAIEFTELADAKRQFDVNFFGMVNITKAVLPYMRKARGGRIINISSIAAIAHIPFQAFYSASKAAIDSYSCALANEVKPFGITVASIQPGDIHTGFTSSRKLSLCGDDTYNNRISNSIKKMELDEKNGMSSTKAASYIIKIALKKKIKPLYSMGFKNELLCFLIKIFPSSIKNRIIYKLYAK